MCAYQAADGGAFERLYAIVGPEIRRYLRGLAGDAELGDELFQETFLQIHRARSTYQPGRPVRPWMFAIARYVFLMERRGRARARRLEAVAAQASADSAPGLFQRHMAAQSLAALDAGEREPLRLRYLEGLDFRQISARLGLTAGAARTRVSRALASLRRLLT